MNLYKRGNVWWLKFMRGGKLHRMSCHTKSKTAAEKWMKNIATAAAVPSYDDAVKVLKMLFKKPIDGDVLVTDIWESYASVAKAVGKDKVKTRTWERRKNRVDNFIDWLEDNAPVKYAEQISGPIAVRYAQKLAEDKLKSKTRKNILGELGTVWRLLAKVSDGIANPWEDILPRDDDSTIGKAFTPEQEKKVLEAAKKVGKDWYPICVIMRNTGLRYEDVAMLMWDEIEDGVLRVVPDKTKKFNIKVALPLVGPAAEVIAGLERRGEWLFPVHAHCYGKRTTMSKKLAFGDVLDAAKVPRSEYTIHSWRHTAATRLAETGADIETRKRILGHTVDATARRYDHDEHLEETKAALERAAK